MRLVVSFVLASCVAAMLSGASAMAQAAPQQAPSGQQASPPATTQPAPAAAAASCLYSGRSYGDGALVCVQKSLMLRCAVEDARAAWSVVPDKDLGDKCLAAASRGTVYQQRARWNRQNIKREIFPPN